MAHGLRALINEDESLNLVADGVPHDQLTSALSTYHPDVALLNFGSLTSALELRDLHRNFTDTRLVRARQPPDAVGVPADARVRRDRLPGQEHRGPRVLHAIHLASRGLHVLPPAGMEPGDLVGPDLLTPREAEVMELLQQGRSNAEIAEMLQRQRRDGPHARAADLPQARGADQARSAGAPLSRTTRPRRSGRRTRTRSPACASAAWATGRRGGRPRCGPPARRRRESPAARARPPRPESAAS